MSWERIVQTVECPGREYTFTFPVKSNTRPPPGPEGQIGRETESFVWQNSRGPEIQTLARGSFGWKLVHSSSPGREPVAAIAHNNIWGLRKGMTFAFLESGLTGVFGGIWEAMVVLSGVYLWTMDFRNLSSAARAARDS